MTIWLRDNNTTCWAEALPIVQAMKNRRYHSGIKRSPYEAMFGKKMELGNEQGDATPVQEEAGDDEDKFKVIDGTGWLDLERPLGDNLDNDLDAFGDQVTSTAEPFEDLDDDRDAFFADLDAQEELNARFFSQQEQRQGAREGQQKQAEKMLESSNKR